MKIIGLTGSIATGKTFIANYLAQKNIKIFFADFEVSKLLQNNKIIDKISSYSEFFSVVKNNLIDKNILSKIVFQNQKNLQILEDILHPVIEERVRSFIKNNSYEDLIVLEIPLLFEKKYQVLCDKVITTYCSPKIQIKRALDRLNIDSERLNFIINKQMPINYKALLTDYIVYTDISDEYTIKQVNEIFKW